MLCYRDCSQQLFGTTATEYEKKHSKQDVVWRNSERRGKAGRQKKNHSSTNNKDNHRLHSESRNQKEAPDYSYDLGGMASVWTSPSILAANHPAVRTVLLHFHPPFVNEQQSTVRTPKSSHTTATFTQLGTAARVSPTNRNQTTTSTTKEHKDDSKKTADGVIEESCQVSEPSSDQASARNESLTTNEVTTPSVDSLSTMGLPTEDSDSLVDSPNNTTRETNDYSTDNHASPAPGISNQSTIDKSMINLLFGPLKSTNNSPDNESDDKANQDNNLDLDNAVVKNASAELNQDGQCSPVELDFTASAAHNTTALEDKPESNFVVVDSTSNPRSSSESLTEKKNSSIIDEKQPQQVKLTSMSPSQLVLGVPPKTATASTTEPTESSSENISSQQTVHATGESPGESQGELEISQNNAWDNQGKVADTISDSQTGNDEDVEKAKDDLVQKKSPWWSDS